MLLDEIAQRIDGRIGGLERRRARTRAARCEPHHGDGDEREIAAHGEAVALAGEEALLVEIGAQAPDPLDLGFAGQRHHRIGRERTQAGQRFAGALAEPMGDILGEGEHPALGGVGAKAEAVRDGGGDDDRGGRIEADRLRLEGHLAAAAHDQQYLEQIAVAVGTDGPVVDRGARRDRLDVDEIERLIVRRIAVEMKQRQGGTAGHAPV